MPKGRGDVKQSETLLLECLLHWLEEHMESALEFAKALSESGFENATIEEELYSRGYSDLEIDEIMKSL